MSFQRFKEYLDDKGELQKKPIIKADADTGPEPKKGLRPPKAVTKGKNWKNYMATAEAAQISDNGNGALPTPYSAPGTDPGLLTADGGKDGKPGKGNADPLGEKGPKDLIYKPKTEDQRLKMAKLHDTTPENTKTEQFLNKTKGLSPTQYAEYVLKQNSPKGVKQVVETVDTIKENPVLLETLVREIKRKGGFAPLIATILSQPETYAEIAASLANESKGKEVARQLAKAINEITAEETEEPAVDDFVNKKTPNKQMIQQRQAPMPPNGSQINARGNPVEPGMNARTRPAKTVQDTPLPANSTDNIMQSRMMRPEHHLIEALANYRSIRSAMKKLVD
jgi:nitrogen regulatory protein PII-like uncharacterized protein